MSSGTDVYTDRREEADAVLEADVVDEQAGSNDPGGSEPSRHQDRGAASSLALRDIPVPDYCDVVIVPTRGVDESDPRIWAEAIFAHENTPLSTRGVRALRDEAIRLFDMVPPPEKNYAVAEVRGGEALIKDDTENLVTRIGVALLPGGALLQVTTAVKFRSIRGRMAFAPRRIMHAASVNTLARRASTTVRRQEMTPGGSSSLRSVTGQAARKALGRKPARDRA